MFIKKITYFLLILVFLSILTSNAAQAKTCKNSEILTCFEEYRYSLTDDSKNASRFFSKAVNEYWLSLFLKDMSVDEALMRLRSVNNRAFFGRDICQTFNTSVEFLSDKRAILKIPFYGKTNTKPFLYNIEYIKESDSWYIASTTLDTTYTQTPKQETSLLSNYCE